MDDLLKKLGGRVQTIITDNNRVNINLFKQLHENPLSFMNIKTLYPQKTFLMFDPVHLIKNARNNFINKEEIKYRIIESDLSVKICHAKFEHIYDLFKESENSPLKISHSLTLRSMVPTSMERQKTSLALKIFNIQNVMGLEYLAEKKSDPSYLETAYFIKKFTLWFDCFNVKTTDKGTNRNDPLSHPIDSMASDSISFFTEFAEWMEEQRTLKNKFFTKPTNDAFLTSTKAIIDISSDLIYSGYYGILTGNFQSDSI